MQSCWFSWASRISVILWSWACAFYVMVFKIQWKPHFWIATQNYLLNDWAGWQFRVNYAGVFAQAPFNISTDLWKTMHPTVCYLKVSSNNTDTDTHAPYKWLTGILIPSLRIKYIISSDPVRALKLIRISWDSHEIFMRKWHSHENFSWAFSLVRISFFLTSVESS